MDNFIKENYIYSFEAIDEKANADGSVTCGKKHRKGDRFRCGCNCCPENACERTLKKAVELQEKKGFTPEMQVVCPDGVLTFVCRTEKK